MSLSADDAQGVFLALGQIASKGKVQAEELRGQIGERVPGAFGIAARAMGVTTAELDKMMEQGKLTASDFLPKFAAEMEKTFQGAVPKAANSLQANMNRISNAFYDFKVGVTPIISGFVSIFAGLAIWAQKNAELIGTFAKVMVYTGGIVAIAAAAQWVYNTSVSVGAFLAGGFTGVVASLNAVFLANPIAWVVGLIAALVVGIIAAWNNFAGFRGFLVGMWAVMKEFGSIIYDYMIAPLMAFGKVLIGAFTLDPAMVTAGISDGIAAVDRITKAGGIGTRLGGAFSKGFADGAASETKIDPIGAMFGKQGGAASVQGGATIIPAGGASGAGGGGIGLNSKLDSVSGGGREGVKNITVSIGKMIETLSFNTTNISESKDKIRAELEKLILDISNDFNYAH
jgi:tape measure domain-containing protein